MLLGAAYFLATAMLTNWLHNGGPGWLNVLALRGSWNGVKFLTLEPMNLVLLARALIAEHRDEAQRIKAQPGHS